jgi:hypothetical protein
MKNRVFITKFSVEIGYEVLYVARSMVAFPSGVADTSWWPYTASATSSSVCIKDRATEMPGSLQGSKRILLAVKL